MDRFQKGLLLGEEVTELLGTNAKFSMQVLANSPQTHAYSIQLSELARKYPIETGHISIGMFVRTPCGWGRIESIEDRSGLNLQFISKNEKEVRFYLVLYPDTSYSLKAILDIENEKMNLLGSEKFYQCGKCGFVATSQDIILRKHTREMHTGLGSSFSQISSRIAIRGELQFSKGYPA
jgi:hypothetical protein